MTVYYDAKLTYVDPRLHPYVAALSDQSGHVDFKAQPELIPMVLEDFRPFASQAAVQTFYSFLSWINGPDSCLETNDCALRPPGPHQNACSTLALCAHGRVFILYRDLALNSSREHSDWLCGALMASLAHTDPAFPPSEAVVGFTLNSTIQTAISTGNWLSESLFDAPGDDPGLGRHLMLSFWVHGDTPEVAFANLDRLFANLCEACKMVSGEIASATGHQ